MRRIISGFPWYPYTQKDSGHPGSVQLFRAINKTDLGRIEAQGAILDPMENFDGICRDFDKASECLEEHQTEEFCLRLNRKVFAYVPFVVFKTFKFFCLNQTRNENLLRSLRCLHDTRLPSMLYYHIATECRQGMDILDQQMLAIKKRFLYEQNSRVKIGGIFKIYICLPQLVLSTCVHKLAEKYCGTMAADLLVNFVKYMQEEENRALKSLGQAADLCNWNISLDRPRHFQQKNSDTEAFRFQAKTMKGDPRKAVFFAMLSKNYSDTELDTFNGMHGTSRLMKASAPEICGNVVYVRAAYMLCVWQAHDIREIPKFNILQYAHILLPFYYHGSHCWRIGQFTQCWKALQNLCGSGPTRYFAQHATLMIDGCRLQDKMDDISSHWQDFVLPAYIKAKRFMISVRSGDPMRLAGYAENPLSCFPDYEILWPAVDKISARCGTDAGNYLRRILQKIRYSQYDVLAYLYLPKT